jgi:hypothetical protein
MRLTLDIPAVRHTLEGEKISTVLYQISIGGCLIEWDDSIEEMEEFRMEVQLPDKNWLPLNCKALYQFPDDGVGVQFQGISEFEQELIAQVMSSSLEQEGIPLDHSPFEKPKAFVEGETTTAELGPDSDA